MSASNVMRIMHAAGQHYKATLGSCGCSICEIIKMPDICPDLEELISYNRSVRKQPVIISKNVRAYIPPPPPAITCANGVCDRQPTERTSRAGSEWYE